MKKPKETQGDQPNIVFVGKGADKKTDLEKRLTLINNGMEKITLPDDQAAPFYHPQARTIITLYPALYKQFR